MKKINEAGLGIIKKYEDLYLEAYKCPAGVWTIGYGHTGETAKPGKRITKAQAEELLKGDVKEAEKAVERLAKVPLTDNEYSALVSFTFNLGSGNLSKSTLLKLINSGNKLDAVNEFPKWRNAGGKALKGLSRRRFEEGSLFLK